MGNWDWGKIRDRDITEWDITEVDLYGTKIREICPASSWDITEVGIQVGGI